MADDDLRAEVARLRAGEADHPGTPNTVPTPTQWIRRWNDLPAGRRLAVAEGYIHAADRARRCFEMDHEGLEEAEAASLRNRIAALEANGAELLAKLQRTEAERAALQANTEGALAICASRDGALAVGIRAVLSTPAHTRAARGDE